MARSSEKFSPPFLNAVCDITFSSQQWLNIFEGIAFSLLTIHRTLRLTQLLCTTPHRSTLSPSISLTSTNTVRILPLSQPPPPFLDRATQPPKEAPTSGWSRISTLASPSTQPYYSTRPPSPVPTSPRMPSHRWSQIMMAKRYYSTQPPTGHPHSPAICI